MEGSTLPRIVNVCYRISELSMTVVAYWWTDPVFKEPYT